MKFQGNPIPRSKIDTSGGGGNALSQMMAMQMMLGKGQMGQQASTQPGPGGMVATSLQPGQPAPTYQSPGGEAQVAAAKASAVAPIEVEKAKQQQQQTEAQESIMRGDAAVNQLQYGVSRFKALQQANQIQPGVSGLQQRIQGTIGHIVGMTGQNPEDKAWNDYTRTVATQLSAAASPRTPTLLVQYYQSVLGPGNQTDAEFARRVHILTSEIEGRKAGYLQVPYNQDMVDKRVQGILSTPAAKDPMSFFPKDTADTGLPQGNPTTNSPFNSDGRIKVRSLSNGKTGTISSSKFDATKYARI